MQRIEIPFSRSAICDKLLYRSLNISTKISMLLFIFLNNRLRFCHALQSDKRFSSMSKISKPDRFGTHASLPKAILELWLDSTTTKGLSGRYSRWFNHRSNCSLVYQKTLSMDDPFNRLRKDWFRSVYSNLSTLRTVFQGWYADLWLVSWLFTETCYSIIDFSEI